MIAYDRPHPSPMKSGARHVLFTERLRGVWFGEDRDWGEYLSALISHRVRFVLIVRADGVEALAVDQVLGEQDDTAGM